jgi:phospholipase C
MRCLGSLALSLTFVAACGGDYHNPDASIDAEPPTMSAIRHVVVIVEENHTFDNYFGRWCTAPAGSDPTCTDGPACCEAAPATDPSGATPIVLDDTANGARDLDHTKDCEDQEVNGGAMDHFAEGPSCADARNIAIAPADAVATYQGWASQYALADRYFQPITGPSSSNDMYFAVARYVFTDNTEKPDSNGAGCTLPATRTTLDGQTTVADVVLAAHHTFAFYAEGYAAMKATLFCPDPPSDCAFGLPTTPCDYDPSDVPFEYYSQFLDNDMYMKDGADLATDIAAGQLPDLVFVKHLGYRNEHPGYGTKISVGVTAVSDDVAAIEASPYADDTLILLTWDEGGGFWDHVAPPSDSSVDHQPYGTRVPLIAIGKFARAHTVSHQALEHSSVVKFIEWNFTGSTGQLGARDTEVHNLGSLIDPVTAQITVPD